MHSNTPQYTRKADRLLGTLKDLFSNNDILGIIELAENVHECVTVCADHETCAETIFFLGTAFSTNLVYLQAISCFNVAYALLTSDARMNEDQASESVQKKALVSKVCNGMANALVALGKFEEAHSYLVECVSINIKIATLKQDVMPYILSLAQNFHAQNKHKESIDMIHELLAYGCNSNDNDDDYHRDDISNYNVWYFSSICPALLLGRCYMALGEYARAQSCFLQACRQAEDLNEPEAIVTAQLNSAVSGWVSNQCFQHAFKCMWANSSECDFGGPSLSPVLIQKHIVLLAASACKKLHGSQGEISISVKLNADGNPTRVMESDTYPRGIKLMLVKWQTVEREHLDHTGFPLSMNLLIEVETEQDRCFVCKLVTSSVFLLGCNQTKQFHCQIANASMPHTLLTEYIGLVLHWAQFGDEKIKKQSMLVLTSSVFDIEKIASKYNLFELRQDCLLFHSIFVFADGFTPKATEIFKNFLQHQVNRAKEPDPTCLTCKQLCRGITVCGGCTVVRFCNTSHQKQASKRPFFSTTIQHRKICPLLLLCKSLTKSLAKPGSESAEATLLSQQFDLAIVQFLHTDFSGKYIQNAQDFKTC